MTKTVLTAVNNAIHTRSCYDEFNRIVDCYMLQIYITRVNSVTVVHIVLVFRFSRILEKQKSNILNKFYFLWKPKRKWWKNIQYIILHVYSYCMNCRLYNKELI